MKIDNKALKQLYDHYLDEISPESREDCPSPEMLLKSIRQALTRKRKREILTHLSECIHCSREMELLIIALREENETEQKISQILESIDTQRKPESAKYSLFSVFPKKFIYTVATALIIAIIGFVAVRIQQQNEYRRARASPLKIEFPRDTRIPISKLVFRWEGIPGTDFYIIEIFDDTLLPFWKSTRLKENVLFPSQSLLGKFKADKRYFWMVTAFDEKGKSIESRLEDYFIKK